MSDDNLDEIDPTFVEDLKESRNAVQRVADYLRRKGWQVEMPETIVRPDPSVRMAYSDRGDLFATQPGGLTLKIEVKQRKGITFTGLHDFPFPTIMVDVCHAFDAKRPDAYFILNRAMDTALIVWVPDTQRHWIQTRKRDNHANRERCFYECPIEYLHERQIKPQKEKA